MLGAQDVCGAGEVCCIAGVTGADASAGGVCGAGGPGAVSASTVKAATSTRWLLGATGWWEFGSLKVLAGSGGPFNGGELTKIGSFPVT